LKAERGEALHRRALVLAERVATELAQREPDAQLVADARGLVDVLARAASIRRAARARQPAGGA